VGRTHECAKTNTQLTDFMLCDLNREPKLGFDDASFDAVLCVVSIDYLSRPREVIAEFHRVLRSRTQRPVVLR